MILSFPEELDCQVDLHQDGYLFLLTKAEEVESFRRNVQLQNRLGVPSEFVEPQQISCMAPHVSLDGILGGTYCAWDGIGEPNGMTQGYAAGARRLGVDIRTAAF